MMAQRGSRVVAVLFNLNTRCRWVVNTNACLLYPWHRDPVSFIEEAGWGPGPVWMEKENLAPTRV